MKIEGRSLLAHELTHVIQQGAKKPSLYTVSPQTKSRLDDRVENRINSGDMKENIVEIHGVNRQPYLRRITDRDCDPSLEDNVSRAQNSAAKWTQAALLPLENPESVSDLLRTHFAISDTGKELPVSFRGHPVVWRQNPEIKGRNLL